MNRSMPRSFGCLSKRQPGRDDGREGPAFQQVKQQYFEVDCEFVLWAA